MPGLFHHPCCSSAASSQIIRPEAVIALTRRGMDDPERLSALSLGSSGTPPEADECLFTAAQGRRRQRTELALFFPFVRFHGLPKTLIIWARVQKSQKSPILPDKDALPSPACFLSPCFLPEEFHRSPTVWIGPPLRSAPGGCLLPGTKTSLHGLRVSVHKTCQYDSC